MADTNAAAPGNTQAPAAATPGQVDVDALLAKINVPPNLQGIFDKAVLSGMRIMFDTKSHAMMQQELAKPGPLAQKMVEGITALVYMLWKQSNQTLPPQIIVPLTFALTLKVFDYLQRSGDPEATKDLLGQALEGAISTVMRKFGVDPDHNPQGGAAPASSAPATGGAPTGLLAQGDANG